MNQSSLWMITFVCTFFVVISGRVESDRLKRSCGGAKHDRLQAINQLDPFTGGYSSKLGLRSSPSPVRSVLAVLDYMVDQVEGSLERRRRRMRRTCRF